MFHLVELNSIWWNALDYLIRLSLSSDLFFKIGGGSKKIFHISVLHEHEAIGVHMSNIGDICPTVPKPTAITTESSSCDIPSRCIRIQFA